MPDQDAYQDPGSADRIYEELLNLHAGLTEEESEQAHIRLILLLAAHIGDPAAIAQHVATVSKSLAGGFDPQA